MRVDGTDPSCLCEAIQDMFTLQNGEGFEHIFYCVTCAEMC